MMHLRDEIVAFVRSPGQADMDLPDDVAFQLWAACRQVHDGMLDPERTSADSFSLSRLSLKEHMKTEPREFLRLLRDKKSSPIMRDLIRICLGGIDGANLTRRDGVAIPSLVDQFTGRLALAQQKWDLPTTYADAVVLDLHVFSDQTRSHFWAWKSLWDEVEQRLTVEDLERTSVVPNGHTYRQRARKMFDRVKAARTERVQFLLTTACHVSNPPATEMAIRRTPRPTFPVLKGQTTLTAGKRAKPESPRRPSSASDMNKKAATERQPASNPGDEVDPILHKLRFMETELQRLRKIVETRQSANHGDEGEASWRDRFRAEDARDPLPAEVHTLGQQPRLGGAMPSLRPFAIQVRTGQPPKVVGPDPFHGAVQNVDYAVASAAGLVPQDTALTAPLRFTLHALEGLRPQWEHGTFSVPMALLEGPDLIPWISVEVNFGDRVTGSYLSAPRRTTFLPAPMCLSLRQVILLCFGRSCPQWRAATYFAVDTIELVTVSVRCNARTGSEPISGNPMVQDRPDIDCGVIAGHSLRFHTITEVTRGDGFDTYLRDYKFSKNDVLTIKVQWPAPYRKAPAIHHEDWLTLPDEENLHRRTKERVVAAVSLYDAAALAMDKADATFFDSKQDLEWASARSSEPAFPYLSRFSSATMDSRTVAATEDKAYRRVSEKLHLLHIECIRALNKVGDVLATLDSVVIDEGRLAERDGSKGFVPAAVEWFNVCKFTTMLQIAEARQCHEVWPTFDLGDELAAEGTNPFAADSDSLCFAIDCIRNMIWSSQKALSSSLSALQAIIAVISRRRPQFGTDTFSDPSWVRPDATLGKSLADVRAWARLVAASSDVAQWARARAEARRGGWGQEREREIDMRERTWMCDEGHTPLRRSPLH